jgi:hypothetical protein
MVTMFVSYGRENQEIVGALTRDLDALGHKTWFDQDLTSGRAWWNHIIFRIVLKLGLLFLALSLLAAMADNM